ncbi:MAG: hypothetical protein ACW99J_20940 [Candidatus Thorarchaeota archaeon]
MQPAIMFGQRLIVTQASLSTYRLSAPMVLPVGDATRVESEEFTRATLVKLRDHIDAMLERP